MVLASLFVGFLFRPYSAGGEIAAIGNTRYVTPKFRSPLLTALGNSEKTADWKSGRLGDLHADMVWKGDANDRFWW